MKEKQILLADSLYPESPVTRRSFLNQSLTMGASVVAGGQWAQAAVGKSPSEPAETLVTSFYKSLKEEQKKAMVFPFDHPLRSAVDNNWHIVDQRIGQLFDADQQAMVREIFLQIHSEEYRDKVMHQFVSDNRSRKDPSEEAAFASSAVAVFGEPGQGDFEWVFTGRHCTRRCDGDSVAGAAFGGPIFYGHAAGSFNEKPDHPGNVYWFQAERANQVFQMLDGKQRGKALLEGAGRKEQASKTVDLTGKTDGLDGLSVAEMSADQKTEMRKVMDDLLAPFRKEDRDEAMKLIQAQFDHLHLAFYKKEDIGNDGMWDVWQVEGPSMVWHFRGSPHVHTWVNIKKEV